MPVTADNLTAAKLLDPRQRPAPDVLIAQLLGLEKLAKREKHILPFAALQGSWRLIFITGTKKAQNQAGKALGKGRYLPAWISVAIAYTPQENQDPIAVWQRGTVQNSVRLGPLQLALAGPLKFQAKKRLLAFDFTHLVARLGGLTLYQGQIRGGQETDTAFYEMAIAKQAFFSYFYGTSEVIAARGRGGGVALWVKMNDF
ncbi:hypothetical protein FLX56_17220 [Synechococcus moorigangaii CMS01]|nr:hypothetical protein [Synechococcus moorigangaii CMS01]